MKIGIDGTIFSDRGHLNRGIGRYTKNLVSHLLRIDVENQYEMVMPEGHLSEYTCDLNLRVTVRKAPRLLKERQFITLQLSSLPGAGRALWRAFDLIFFPTHLYVLLAPPTKSIVTVLDLIPEIFSAQYRIGSQAKMHSQARKYAARRSDMIITLSECSKKDIVERYRVSEEKVRVLHLAPNETFRRVDKSTALDWVERNLGIRDRFILYVGGFDYRKNLMTLVAAFSYMKRKFKPDHKLIIAGPIPANNQFALIFKKIVSLNLSRDVRFTDFVTDDDLVLLYNAADLFVFPSLYEGFGLPPLEAMACGTPVVSSNRSSMPEVIGDAAILVDPSDVEALADAMHNVLSNEALKTELTNRGLQRAKAFSWEKTAKEGLNLFNEVIQS
jgi:glycosyltransferase involved in cell wall biosynthesis